jgi:hypothetical protein
MYGVLRNLNYKPWYAFAEFVDNAVQSFVQNESYLRKVHGSEYKLRVQIELQPQHGRIFIRDNAAGIAGRDFPRAFRPAQVPPDRRGLSEFGMGMKSAACWFASAWKVRTCALGEPIERTVEFDVDEIIASARDELVVFSRAAHETEHYTELTLSGIHQFPVKKTIAKIKEHLSGIYREFTRAGILELKFGNELLDFEEPKILVAPFYKLPTSEALQWKKPIDFRLSGGQRIVGFAALREKGSTTYAGFALFRRRRLIVGSGDSTYRPQEIFGNSTSFVYQRLFGELHLDDFHVSHTKDGFQWDAFEDEFLEKLKEILDEDPLPLLAQAQEYRVNTPRDSLVNNAVSATERTANAVEVHAPPVVERQISAKIPTPPPSAPQSLSFPIHRASCRTFDLKLNGQFWKVVIETVVDPAVADWLAYSKRDLSGTDVRTRSVDIRVNLSHPFVDRFVGVEQENIELLLRLAVGLALSLISAQDVGMGKGNSVILGNFNELLRDALSRID